MKYNLVLSPQAKTDIKEAFDYYENIAAKLGEHFGKVLNDIISKILDHPTSGSIRINNIRSRTIKVFPYAVYYVLKDEHIIIVRVFNTHQHPFW